VQFPVEYDVAFSTFLGGTDWERARDVCSDAEGNVYVVGETASNSFPVTPAAWFTNAYRGAYAGGQPDGIVARFVTHEPAGVATLLAGATALLRRPQAREGNSRYLRQEAPCVSRLLCRERPTDLGLHLGTCSCVGTATAGDSAGSVGSANLLGMPCLSQALGRSLEITPRYGPQSHLSCLRLPLEK